MNSKFMTYELLANIHMNVHEHETSTKILHVHETELVIYASTKATPFIRHR
jgi:hypothetical protein